ncbi:uncharacterized protein AKAW2_10551A [Aspergillus luchuensis]|uniref:Uncharacterized protein n=1 Tax=Aspergillus kawachii TaxID=1069201 RepID=A0A7R7VZC4_ASPKA|nr:uncharacterized protein AKAW2_10551A [Aspergillus luchuensis]BCR93505.1 hypothetical protein AKAW2_10551A [Aspergillus luchuensis]
MGDWFLVDHWRPVIVKSLSTPFEEKKKLQTSLSEKAVSCQRLLEMSTMARKLQAMVTVVTQPIIRMKYSRPMVPGQYLISPKVLGGSKQRVRPIDLSSWWFFFSHGSNGVHAQSIEALADA